MKKFSLFRVLVIVFLLGFAGIVQADLNDGLVAYYPFNGNANDASGNSNNGTVNGATLTENRFGNVDSAYSFNGNAYINIGQSITPSFFSIIAWIKPTLAVNGDRQTIISSREGTTVNNGFALALAENTNNNITESNTNGNSVFFVKTDKWRHALDTEVATDDTWSFLVGIFDGSQISLYKNGMLIDQEPVTGNYSLSPYSTIIGARASLDRYFFNGIIDDVRIYNRVLSESEVLQLYNENECPECPNDGFTQDDIDNAVNAAVQACIDDPASCGISVGVDCPTSPTQDCAATFDMISNTLHIPNFQDTYWLNFGLISWETVQFELKDVGEIE